MLFLNYTSHQTDLERQQQETQDNANHLQQQVHEKDASLIQLQQELEEQSRENNKLQDDYDSMFNPLEVLIHTISRFIQYNRGKVTVGLVILDEKYKSRCLSCLNARPAK